MRRARLGMVGAVLLTLAACAGPSTAPAQTSAPVSFAEGSTMAHLAASQTVRIGVKTDVPGLGYLPPDSPEGATPVGFDIEIAKIVASRLQIDPSNIVWVALETYDRESALTESEVDLVVATYSMTEDRQQVVGQAGPYYVTGQQIMVREGSDVTGLGDLDGKSVCSVAGSESDAPVVAEGAVTKAFASYAACVDALLAGDLDAISTDGAILAGFLELYPDELIIVGTPFTTQRYGIGYRHGDTGMCQFLRTTLLKAYDDGSWKAAFESTIGKSGIEAPRAPRPDACPAG